MCHSYQYTVYTSIPQATLKSKFTNAISQPTPFIQQFRGCKLSKYIIIIPNIIFVYVLTTGNANSRMGAKELTILLFYACLELTNTHHIPVLCAVYIFNIYGAYKFYQVVILGEEPWTSTSLNPSGGRPLPVLPST